MGRDALPAASLKGRLREIKHRNAFHKAGAFEEDSSATSFRNLHKASDFSLSRS